MNHPDLHIKHVGLAAATLILVAACGAAPTASPSSSPTSQPSATTVPNPSAPGDDGFRVSIANATGNDLSIDVTDASGLVQEALTGSPGDGASVEPYTVLVSNDDPSTLRLIWTGGPCDATDSLSIDGTGRKLLLVEPECPGDAVAYDRILLLHLSSPVDAAEVHAVLQDGLDTEG